MRTFPARLQTALDATVADGALGALAEARDDTSTYAMSSGVSQWGSHRPVDPAGHFRIGSVTKTFTATAVLQLVGDGALGLDDTVERWLPGLLADGNSITVRQLLMHTSGLYNYTEAWALSGALDTDVILSRRGLRVRPQNTVALAERHGARFPPGTAVAYNNTGYILAGMVIERAAAMSYAEHVEQRILIPLRLTRTVVRDEDPHLPQPHAHGYLPAAGEPVDVSVFDRSTAWASGGIVSTARDVNEFFAGLLRGELLGAAQLRQMLTPTPWVTPATDSGLGLVRVHLPGGPAVWGKHGGFFGFDTFSFHAPDASRQLTVSITTDTGRSPTTEQILRHFAFVFDQGPTPRRDKSGDGPTAGHHNQLS
ncbi:serine hydrolase [Catellatospora methionotrophica]|uniref:Serine hydrolase n=1 Tax=Catellatospora methionotrophica TaxID=121620 RepID=A0A8J3LBE4_9ACTN|nr:serine hydrolase domain-containing protein [Catellatospora methionotrophica]GIG15269.1 serine hydrolase [Catellatospora methionotrophica]